MIRDLNKNSYRAILILSFLAINALILFGISAVFSYLNTGADRSSMLHLEEVMDEVYVPKVAWNIDDYEGRPMEQHTLHEIEKDYRNAWYVRNMAFRYNDPKGISDYYTDSAQVKLKRSLTLNQSNETTIKGTTIEHNPELKFYSQDGTMVTFTDRDVISYQEVLANGQVILSLKDTTSYRVMMLLEDGFWRIRHLVEIQKQKQSHKKVTKQNNQKPKTVSAIKGINYYPKDSPWDMFGVHFDATTIDMDFKLMSEMGLNTIRIFIQYEDFGKAKVLPEKLNKLRTVLDLATQNQLKVVITLFDFYGNYSISDWTLTHRHAEAIVSTFKNHDAILAWDIKNEPDLDFESRGKHKVLAWLNQMVANIRVWDQNHAITIGWSNPEVANLLAKQLDFVSFHYYEDVGDFKEAYSLLQQKAPDKPLMLQEYGKSSYSGFWNLFKGSKDTQALYYKEMQALLKAENVPYLSWTLYDFNKIPASVVGTLPWRKQPQAYYGIVDEAGNKKPAYVYLRNRR
ncbi:glycoside hydrolase family 2 TIM barrel-domain containing protein [Spongiimicrobium sp. 3-5]|uniref:glycoside hydrolase family 2 TIM barrel-domain containing protein n=1 Tax=Spongiimicrobium sp. 3-5 TaxID=3332596 RepID=UPI003980AAC1